MLINHYVLISDENIVYNDKNIYVQLILILENYIYTFNTKYYK